MASGEEFVIRQVAGNTSPLSVNRVEVLTNAERMDIMILSGNPAIMSLWKFMEMQIIAARDEAMHTDPAKKDEQIAKLTIAHAMEKFYKDTREDIIFMTQEHLAETRRLEWERRLQEPDELEKAFFENL
jgi:hypothetical protein